MIRRARIDDIRTSLSIFAQSLSESNLYSEPLRKGETEKYRFARLLEILESGVFFVSEDQGMLDGLCFGFDDHDMVYLSWFVVSSERRGQGVGTALVAAFVEDCRERTHKIWCDTRSNNLASHAIMKRSGFSIFATVKRHWYDQDFIMWEKLLR